MCTKLRNSSVAGEGGGAASPREISTQMTGSGQDNRRRAGRNGVTCVRTCNGYSVFHEQEHDEDNARHKDGNRNSNHFELQHMPTANAMPLRLCGGGAGRRRRSGGEVVVKCRERRTIRQQQRGIATRYAP